MAKQTIKRKGKYRKSKTTTDAKGRKHCSQCGAFISGRGKKK